MRPAVAAATPPRIIGSANTSLVCHPRANAPVLLAATRGANAQVALVRGTGIGRSPGASCRVSRAADSPERRATTAGAATAAAGFPNAVGGVAAGGQATSSSPSDTIVLSCGSRICVKGLQARPEINGQLGRLSGFDSKEGRWKVVMDDGKMLSLRPENLETIHERAAVDRALKVGVRICVKDLNSRPELNGTCGRLLDFDDDEGRWRVEMDDGSGLSLKPGNIDCINDPARDDAATIQSGARGSVRIGHEPGNLQAGMRISIQGLKSRTDLNGACGQLLDFDAGLGRWRVVMDDGTGLSLRPESLIRIGPRLPDSTTHVSDSLHDTAAISPSPAADINSELLCDLVAGMRISIKGLQSRSELNGRSGTLLEFDADEERWRIVMDDGTGLSLRPANIVRMQASSVEPASHPRESWYPSTSISSEPVGDLAEGMRICVQGLSKRPDLNGCQGRLLNFDAVEGRWRVVMEDGSGLSLRPLNLAKLALPSQSSEASSTRIARRPHACEEDSTLEQPGGLKTGLRVCVRGLTNLPEYNGLRGKLLDFDTTEGKWRVVMDDGTELRLRPLNLQGPLSCEEEEDSDWVRVVPSGGGGTSGSCSRALVEKSAAVGGAEKGMIFDVGARVRLKGLVMRPELNGRHGTLLEFDVAEHRWRVLMEDGSGLSLRPSSLEVAQDPWCAQAVRGMTHAESADTLEAGMKVRLQGLKARHELNGKLGTLLDFDAEDGRWKVVMEDGSGLSLRPANLEIVHTRERKSASVDSTVARGDGQAAASNCPAASEGGELRRRFQNFLRTGKRVCIPGETIAAKGAHAAPAAPNGASGAAPHGQNETSLHIGSRVRVIGLRARPDLNGRYGHLRAYEEKDDRWQVWFDDGFGKLLRSSNLEPCLTLPSAASQSTPQSQANQELVPGIAVRVVGLPARPDLEGRRGRLLGACPANNGRQRVELNDGVELSLRPENLTPDFQTGGCDPRSDGLKVAGSDGHVGSIHDIELQSGERVCVKGLVARPDMNGRQGTLLEFDKGEGRWRVVMDDGCGLSLHPANLEASRRLAQTSSTAKSGQGSRHSPELVKKTMVELLKEGFKPESNHLRTQSKSPVVGVAADIEPGARVRVKGLTSRPELNGREGTVLEYDADEGRWRVVMDDGGGLSLRPAALERSTNPTNQKSSEPSRGSGKVSTVDPEFGKSLQPNVCDTHTGPTPAASSAMFTGDVQIGARVRTKGIASRPELNGRRGTLLGFDPSEGRWRVVMEDSSGLSLRPANLELSESNASPSESPAFEPIPEENADGQTVVEFQPGTRVRVKRCRPDLKGQEGTLLEYDAGDGHWRIVMSDGSCLSLPRAALELSEFHIRMDPSVSSTYLPSDDCKAAPIAATLLRPGMRVRVHGQPPRPELTTMREATLLEFDQSNGHWQVIMDDGYVLSLNATNLEVPPTLHRPQSSVEVIETETENSKSVIQAVCEFQPGARVRARGLSDRPELNGLLGILLKYETNKGRWQVVMEDGCGLSLRPDNLEAVPDTYGVRIHAMPPSTPGQCALADPSAMEFQSGARVLLTGLTARPELNGQLGSLLDFDATESRWRVVLDDGTGLSLRPANLESAGAAAVLSSKLRMAPPDESKAQRRDEEEVLDEVMEDPDEDGVATLRVGAAVRLEGLGGRPELNGQHGVLLRFDVSAGRWEVALRDGSFKMLRPENLVPAPPPISEMCLS